MIEIADDDRDVLDFERQRFVYAGVKESAIRERFGCSSTRYYQMLNAIIVKPEAMAYDPLLVKRLQRLKVARAQQRSVARLGFDI